MSQCHCAADHMNSMMGSCSVPWLQRKLRSVLQISNTALLSAGSQIEPQRAQPVPVGHTHLNTSLGSCDPRCLTAASNFQHGGQARRHSVRAIPPLHPAHTVPAALLRLGSRRTASLLSCPHGHRSRATRCNALVIPFSGYAVSRAALRQRRPEGPAGDVRKFDVILENLMAAG